jgi:hypothetical protein
MPLKLCMVGLDTSHATEFTARLHDTFHPEHVPGARVVIAMPLGSADIPCLRTGRAPVTAADTLAIYRFMAAANESLRRGGEAVALAVV